MSEPPPIIPPDPAPRTEPKPLNIGIGCALSAALFVVSCALSIAAQSPIPFGLGAITAFVCLVFRRTRMIGVWYVATIASIILLLVVICGSSGW